jgi:hydrogenase maturation factor
MRVLEVDKRLGLALCVQGTTDTTGGEEEVAIDLVEPVAPGEILLVHAGVALANLSHTPAELEVQPQVNGDIPPGKDRL